MLSPEVLSSDYLYLRSQNNQLVAVGFHLKRMINILNVVKVHINWMEKQRPWLEITISQADTTDHFKFSNFWVTAAASIDRLHDQVLHPDPRASSWERAETNYQHRSSSKKWKAGSLYKGLHHRTFNTQLSDCNLCLQNRCSVCKLHHT